MTHLNQPQFEGPDDISWHIEHIQEEYEIETPELIGEPVRTLTGGSTAIYSDPEQEQFVIVSDGPVRFNGSASYPKAEIVRYGAGNLMRGIVRAVDVFNDPQLDDDDDSNYFFSVANKVSKNLAPDA